MNDVRYSPLPSRRLCPFPRCTFPSPCPDHEMTAEAREAFWSAGHRCSPECNVPLTRQSDEHATVLLTTQIRLRDNALATINGLRERA